MKNISDIITIFLIWILSFIVILMALMITEDARVLWSLIFPTYITVNLTQCKDISKEGEDNF